MSTNIYRFLFYQKMTLGTCHFPDLRICKHNFLLCYVFRLFFVLPLETNFWLYGRWKIILKKKSGNFLSIFKNYYFFKNSVWLAPFGCLYFFVTFSDIKWSIFSCQYSNPIQGPWLRSWVLDIHHKTRELPHIITFSSLTPKITIKKRIIFCVFFVSRVFSLSLCKSFASTTFWFLLI